VKSCKIAYKKRIINIYYRAVANPNRKDISYGFKKENIIENGQWDGDLMKLIISDTLFNHISNFINIDSRPIKTYLEIINNKLFLFDFSNNRILNLDINGTINSEVEIEQRKCRNQKIIKDDVGDIIYLICNDNDIFELNPQTGEAKLKYTISSDYLYPKNVYINDGELYFMSYDYSKYTFNKLIRIKLK